MSGSLRRRLEALARRAYGPSLPALPRHPDEAVHDCVDVYEQHGGAICQAWLIANGVPMWEAAEIVDAMNAVPEVM